MEHVEKLYPQNFRELFSFFVFIVSLIFAFISLNKKRIEHNLRMASILFIVSISLYAHNGYCYFGAIFIIATAVTQLDFLQNLAAIIRGSKEYFDYKKETKPPVEVQQDIAMEVLEMEKTSVEDDAKTFEKEISSPGQPINEQRLSPGQFGMLVEEHAFRYLEKKFQRPIQRYVRMQSKRYIGDFDGIMQFGETDIIFELKASRMGVFPISLIKNTIDKLVVKIEAYHLTTKRNAVLRLILIGNFENEFKNKIRTRIPEFTQHGKGLEITIEFLSFAEIELNIDNDSIGN